MLQAQQLVRRSLDVKHDGSRARTANGCARLDRMHTFRLFGAVTFVQGPPAEQSLHDDGGSSGSTDFPPYAWQWWTGAHQHTGAAAPEPRYAWRRAVIGNNGVIAYEGSNFADASAATRAGTYMLAVVRRSETHTHKRRRMDVYPLEADAPLQLNLRVPSISSLSLSSESMDAVLGTSASMSVRERRDVLIRTFGSRKKQAMERSRAANIVDVAAVAAAEDVAGHLRDAASASVSAAAAPEGEDAAKGSVALRVDATLAAAREFVLPPFNPHAAAVEEAYPLDGLIPRAATDALRPVTDAMMDAFAAGDADAAARAFARASEYLRDRVRATVATGSQLSELVLLRRARCFAYFKCLLELSRAPVELRMVLPRPRETARAPDEAAASGEVAPAELAAALDSIDPQQTATGDAAGEPLIPSLRFVPANVVPVLLQSFAERRADDKGRSVDGVVYVRTREHQDRLIAHMCCTALHADGFKSDIRLLARDLKLTVTRLSHFFRELGCSCAPVREATMEAEPGADADAEPTERKRGKRTAVVSYEAQLLVPLTFPRPSVGRARK